MATLTHQDKLDIAFMQHAIAQAENAAHANEVPVGAVVVLGGHIIGQGFNQTISLCDPSAHAEVLALREAALRGSNHRLTNATLYVTLEPCLMCCGCLLHARVSRLVYGVREPRTGAVVSINESLADPKAMHRVAVTEGVMAEECRALLQGFFKNKRD